MLHACLYTICFVFCYTSCHFYAFSGTNLLTRRHSASSLFSAVCVFQKSYTGNILRIGRNKSRTSYFSRHETKSEDEMVGAWGRPHPRAARPSPAPRHQEWGHLVHLLTPPFCLYIPLDGKNLNARSFFHETYCKPSPSSTRDREGPEALPGTLPERGITIGGLLHHHGHLWGDVWVVYLLHVVFVGIRWILILCWVDVLNYYLYVISMLFMILRALCC
jgi:hypothetical protein